MLVCPRPAPSPTTSASLISACNWSSRGALRCRRSPIATSARCDSPLRVSHYCAHSLRSAAARLPPVLPFVRRPPAPLVFAPPLLRAFHSPPRPGRGARASASCFSAPASSLSANLPWTSSTPRPVPCSAAFPISPSLFVMANTCATCPSRIRLRPLICSVALPGARLSLPRVLNPIRPVSTVPSAIMSSATCTLQ